MRVLFLSAGTGSFYCGTCMRDNAIVTKLRQAGHDVHLMPLYMPFTLDEDDATDCPLFLGGINAYLQQKMGLFRVTPRFIDAIFDWKPLLKLSAQKADMTKASELGELTISTMKGTQGKQAKEIKRMVRWIKDNLEVDVVCLSSILLAGIGLDIKEAINVPVVASMQGEDVYLDSLPDDESKEAWTLMHEHCSQFDALVGVSAFFADYMQKRLNVPPEIVHTIDNGIDLSGYEPAEKRPEPPVLGFFAHITPSKGLHSVVSGFIAVANEPAFKEWRLAIGGSCTESDEKYLNEQLARLNEAGLKDRVTVKTNLSKDEKQDYYREISLLSTVPTYDEAFGLYVIESIASGTPVMVPARGALPNLVEMTKGGVAFPVSEDATQDGDALAAALREHVADAAGLQQLQQAATDAMPVVTEHYSLDRMAQQVYNVFEKLVPAGSQGS